MVIMKSIIPMKAVLAAFAVAVIFVSAVQAGEMDMKSLVVRLGFDRLSDQYTCNGIDISPGIGIQGLNATSLAVIVEDPDAPSGTFTHWLIWNIPPVETIPKAIAKNATIREPFSAVQGINDFGEIGYAGPCPPPGKPHRYFFRVFGLDSMLDLPAGSSVNDLEKAMQGHVLQKGEAVATYAR